jgi:hypothetical protein
MILQLFANKRKKPGNSKYQWKVGKQEFMKGIITFWY